MALVSDSTSHDVAPTNLTTEYVLNQVTDVELIGSFMTLIDRHPYHKFRYKTQDKWTSLSDLVGVLICLTLNALKLIGCQHILSGALEVSFN